MKRKSLTAILLATVISSTLLDSLAYANPTENIAIENTATEQKSEDSSQEEDTNEIEFVPVTINYILEGVNKTLKSSKTLNSKEDFWDNYTVKLSNKLLYGGIDIQEKIRNYYFSHYEINGRRIESIDSIITTSKEESVINVVYSEEAPEDGYLRKGFRDGIGIDFDYLSQQDISESSALTDLYDNSWVLKLPSEFCSEYKTTTENLVNANDKTLYINANINPIPDKEQSALTKKYNYIGSIKISTSMGYNDLENPATLIYTPDDINSSIDGTEVQLLGVNLEGKIEELSSSKAKNNSFEFSVNKNFNKYQFLFVAESKVISENTAITENSNNDNQNNNTLIDNTSNTDTNVISPTDDSNILPNVKEELISDSTKLNETAIVILILICFSAGAIATYILSLIVSIRNKNIEKKKEASKK